MNNDLSNLEQFCIDLKQNRYKSATKCLEVHYDQFVFLVGLYSWEKINEYIYSELKIKKYFRYYQNIFYRVKAKNKNQKIKTTHKHNEVLINTKNKNTNNDFVVDPRFYEMINVTDISFILIRKYKLTYDEVINLNIETIQDSMTVFNIIKKYCENTKAEKSKFDCLFDDD